MRKRHLIHGRLVLYTRSGNSGRHATVYAFGHYLGVC